ncbi:MAG: hypothetical protein HYU64_18315 [Armatimonadetes bacterium]|nr:hypothetical protein [Armatimonadota bacterium]
MRFGLATGILLAVMMGAYLYATIAAMTGTGLKPLSKDGHVRQGSQHMSRHHGFIVGGGLHGGK